MNNLKRVLSLGLTGAMLSGMMVMGASAADVSQFTDGDEITHVEAVNVMTTLGVLQGKDTGAFDPNATVTRAEMAKIITVMLNGGSDITTGTAGTSMYSDVAANHWARSYIEYCSSMGIIAGQGDGTFNPDGPVTGAAAAKMLLVALGYDPDIFGFTGIDWELNVNRIANTEAKLYAEISTIDTSAGLTRDNTAQMAYNALESKLMVTGYDKVVSTGEISYTYALSDQTFLNKYFDAKIFIGTYLGNADTDSLTDGHIKVYGKLDTDDGETGGEKDREATFPSDLDISNIGEEVKVIFKDGKSGTTDRPDKNDTIYGVFNTGKTEVINATKNDIGDSESDTKLKIDGVKYDIAKEVEVVTNYITGDVDTYTSAKALQGAIKKQSADTIKFVCDDEGDIFKAYIVEYKAGRVSAVTSSKVTISGAGAIEIDDNDIYEGVAKDDVVVYTQFYADKAADAYFTVTKAEAVEGEFTGYKKDSKDATYTNVVVDGTTYKVNNAVAALDSLTDDAITEPTDDNIGDTVAIYLVNGMAVALQSLETSGGNYAVITDADTLGNLGSTLNGWQVQILMTDGSEATYVVHKDSTTDGKTKKLTTPEAGEESEELVAGALIEYSIVGGKLKVKEIFSSNAVTTGNIYDKTSKIFTYGTGANKAVAAAGSFLFVGVDSSTPADNKIDDYYVYDLRNLGTIKATSATKVAAETNSNGQVKVAYVNLTAKPASSSADTLYGIVSSYVGVRKVNDENKFQYKVDTNKGQVTVNVDERALTAGELVSFDETSDGTYYKNDFTHVLSVKETKWHVGASKEYSNSILSYYTGTEYNATSKTYDGAGLTSITVDKDVIIVYVNYTDGEAGEDVGIGGFDRNTGYANIAFHTNDDDIVDVIFVNSDNDGSTFKDIRTVADKAALEAKVEEVTAPVLDTIEDAGLTVVTDKNGNVTITGTKTQVENSVFENTGLFNALREIPGFTKATFKVGDTEVEGELLPTGAETEETSLWKNLQAANNKAESPITYEITVNAGNEISTTYTITVNVETAAKA